MKAPVQTEVTYLRRAGLTADEVDGLAIADRRDRRRRCRPGTQSKSRGGQFANVCVGTRPSPQSLGTGRADLAAMCVVDSGKPREHLQRTGEVELGQIGEDDKADVEDAAWLGLHWI